MPPIRRLSSLSLILALVACGGSGGGSSSGGVDGASPAGKSYTFSSPSSAATVRYSQSTIDDTNASSSRTLVVSITARNEVDGSYLSSVDDPNANLMAIDGGPTLSTPFRSEWRTVLGK